eukprot:TRINITY_DN120775_c0_g1_i1.p1 TRINITY_DN120775_c0_g1~~TRINITY_DN120775_c0_g1_i1.p1  ORF type:complete len:1004 (-),score=263.48 TRINITY_DN120775_c0_g1_i1:244-3255(-)
MMHHGLLLPLLAVLWSTDCVAAAEEEGSHGKPSDQVTASISIMLLGSIAFQMSLFYLVNWPDVDIRYYTWTIIGNTISIFSSVLLFQAINGLVERYIIEGNEEYKFVIDVLHMLVWFVILQLTTATISNAVNWDEIKASFHEWRGQEKTRKAALAKTTSEVSRDFLKAKLDNFEETKQLHEKLREAEDGISDAGGSDSEESKEDEERRELNVKCFSMLLAHMTGFAAINAMGDIQHSAFFSQSPLHAFMVLPVVFCVMFGLFQGTNVFRKRIALGDDGEVDEFEELWNEQTEDAENDVLGLVLSFLTTQAVRFSVTGRLPSNEGELPEDIVKATAGRTSCCMSFMCLVWLAATIGIFFADSYALKHYSAESKQKRATSISINYGTMCLAWSALFFLQSVMQRILQLNPDGIIEKVSVALIISFLIFLIIFALDKLADAHLSDSADEAIGYIITSKGLSIGFSWEQSFDVAVTSLSKVCARPALAKLAMASSLCLIVIPAYRWYVMAEVHKREQERDEEKKEELARRKKEVESMGGDPYRTQGSGISRLVLAGLRSFSEVLQEHHTAEEKREHHYRFSRRSSRASSRRSSEAGRHGQLREGRRRSSLLDVPGAQNHSRQPGHSGKAGHAAEPHMGHYGQETSGGSSSSSRALPVESVAVVSGSSARKVAPTENDAAPSGSIRRGSSPPPARPAAPTATTMPSTREEVVAAAGLMEAAKPPKPAAPAVESRSTTTPTSSSSRATAATTVNDKWNFNPQLEKALEASGNGPGDRKELAYLLDTRGAELTAKRTVGLAYRLSMRLEDRDPHQTAIWGSTVRGVDQGNGWLKVQEKFLPFQLNGTLVLLPTAGGSLANGGHSNGQGFVKESCSEAPQQGGRSPSPARLTSPAVSEAPARFGVAGRSVTPTSGRPLLNGNSGLAGGHGISPPQPGTATPPSRTSPASVASKLTAGQYGRSMACQVDALEQLRDALFGASATGAGAVATSAPGLSQPLLGQGLTTPASLR